MSGAVRLSVKVRFQEQVVADMVKEDGLLILGRGLGTMSIVANLLHVLKCISTMKSGKTGLMIVINATKEEDAFLEEELQELNNFKTTNFKLFSDSGAGTIDKRRQMYYEGGIISVSKRIFVADLLNKAIDANLITGIIILHAEMVTEFSTERFIIQLYRKLNKWGFLKSIIDDPERLSRGSQPLRDNLRFSLLERTFIWPRFHRDVKTSIKRSSNALIKQQQIGTDSAKSNSVIEMRIQMTKTMEKIQNALMSSIEQLLGELKRNVTKYSEEHWDMEHSLDRNFIRGIRAALLPQWHRISESAKKLIDEISFVLDVLRALYREDSIAFNQRIQDYFKAIRNNPFDKSFWKMTDHFGTVISCSQSRVRSKENGRVVEVFEESPKWEQLGLILTEIANDRKGNPSNDGPIVIACNDYYMVQQIQKIVRFMKDLKDEDGNIIGFTCRSYMHSTMHSMGEHRKQRDIQQNIAINIEKQERSSTESQDELFVSRTFTGRGKHNSIRRRARGGAIVALHDRLLNKRANDDLELDEDMSPVPENEAEFEILDLNGYNDENGNDFLFMETETISDYKVINRSEEILVGTFQDLKLEEILPSYTILFQPDLTFIRIVEMYQSSIKLSKCYFMCFAASAEEQIYMNDVKYERDSIIKLIKEKANMPKYFFEPEDELAKYKVEKTTLNTRIGGGSISSSRLPNKEKTQVIVDSRELRAHLPFICYLHGLDIVPVQLTVGDYIISDEICIERKSIPDLKSSLEKGRLFEQCTRMFQYYKNPILLIEFDDKSSFSFEQIQVGFLLERKTMTGGAANPSKINGVDSQAEKMQRELMILIKEFPKLTILWASSPLQSAKVIKDIKQKCEEPDLEYAVNAGTLEFSGKSIQNEDSINMLKMIPGIDDTNYFKVISNVQNIVELSKMKEENLKDLIGIEKARLVVKFFSTTLI